MEKCRYRIPISLLEDIKASGGSDNIIFSNNDTELALYCNNNFRYQRFSNVKKSLNFFGYEGESENLDPYWDKVIEKI